MATILFSTLALGFFLVAYWASESGSMWVAGICGLFGLVGALNLIFTLGSG